MYRLHAGVFNGSCMEAIRNFKVISLFSVHHSDCTCTHIASIEALHAVHRTLTDPGHGKKNHRRLCTYLSRSPAGRPCICDLYQRITRNMFCSAWLLHIMKPGGSLATACGRLCNIKVVAWAQKGPSTLQGLTAARYSITGDDEKASYFQKYSRRPTTTVSSHTMNTGVVALVC